MLWMLLDSVDAMDAHSESFEPEWMPGGLLAANIHSIPPAHSVQLQTDTRVCDTPSPSYSYSHNSGCIKGMRAIISGCA